MKPLKDGIRALVRIDFEGNVHKTFRGTDSDKRCANEVKVLQALEERDCPNVPRLLSYDLDSLTIVTTNCGAPAPNLSKKKATSLFDELEQLYGIRHDDPEPRNVTYSSKLGRFCLIDFELAEILPFPEQVSENEASISDEATWRASWHSLTSQGKNHPANDDSHLAFQITPDDARPLDAIGQSLLDPAHLLLAVSDGMGGKQAGEFASRLIMSWIRRHAYAHYDDLEKGNTEPLTNLLNEAHQGLNELAEKDPKLKGMGATLTLAWLTSTHLHFAHIGDSRLYLHRDGETQQLTKDHNIAWSQWKRGQLLEIQYRQHPRRSALYEALGGGHPSINPHIDSVPIQPGDLLLICSDGLIDGLWERHIHEALSEKESDLKAIATEMLARSNNNDDTDDTTLILAQV